jgi:hypothetical protein
MRLFRFILISILGTIRVGLGRMEVQELSYHEPRKEEKFVLYFIFRNPKFHAKFYEKPTLYTYIKILTEHLYTVK